MPRSKLYVDHKVNFSSIVSDRRSTDYARMAKNPEFAARLDEAVAAAGRQNRTDLAAAIGAGENAKQIVGQWVKRQKVPDKYTRPLADLGVSIDYINAGEGSARLRDGKSHAMRSSEETLTKASEMVISQFEQWGVEFRPRDDIDLILGVYDVLASGSTVIDATKWLIQKVEQRGLIDDRPGKVGANRN